MRKLLPRFGANKEKDAQKPTANPKVISSDEQNIWDVKLLERVLEEIGYDKKKLEQKPPIQPGR